MQYANTRFIDGLEQIQTLLPLSVVPGFDPKNPPQDNTYAVSDDVEIGWVKQADGSFLPAPFSRTVPQKVTTYQAHAALYQAGLLDDIEAFMALATTDPLIKLAWQKVLHFERQSEMVLSIGALFGLSPVQLDDLFVFANTIY